MFKPTQCNAYYNPNFVICYYIERIVVVADETNWRVTYKWAIKADMINGSTITIMTCNNKSLAEKELKGLIEQ